jgi:hypothetical protein
MDLNAREGAEIWFRCWKVNVKAVTGGIIELSGKGLNQDVTLMTGGIWNQRNYITLQTTISVSAGEMLKYMLRHLLMQKLAGGSIYIYGSPKQINKETLLRDYHRK